MCLLRLMTCTSCSNTRRFLSIPYRHRIAIASPVVSCVRAAWNLSVIVITGVSLLSQDHVLLSVSRETCWRSRNFSKLEGFGVMYDFMTFGVGHSTVHYWMLPKGVRLRYAAGIPCNCTKLLSWNLVNITAFSNFSRMLKHGSLFHVPNHMFRNIPGCHNHASNW
jgi:hypothetical protein